LPRRSPVPSDIPRNFSQKPGLIRFLERWFIILRLYGPFEPWFNQTWKLDDIGPI
jgi:hypothetical protein